FNPATGQQSQVTNLSVPANAIVVYVGGRAMSRGEAGVGGNGGYSAGGSPDWLATLRSRNPAGYGLWGGSIAFDTNTNWFIGSSAHGIGAYQTDFYPAAMHQPGHVLGVG